MKLSGKMCLKIILKVIKNQGLTLSLKDTFLENHRRIFKLTTPNPLPTPTPRSRFRVKSYKFLPFICVQGVAMRHVLKEYITKHFGLSTFRAFEVAF